MDTFNYLELWSLNKHKVISQLSIVKHFKRKGRDRIQAICPFCDSGSKDNRTSAFSIDVDNGSYTCFSCGRVGNWYSDKVYKIGLREALPIEIEYPVSMQTKTFSKLTKEEKEEKRKQDKLKREIEEKQFALDSDKRKYSIIFDSYPDKDHQLNEFEKRNPDLKDIVDHCKRPSLVFNVNIYKKNLNYRYVDRIDVFNVGEIIKSKLTILQSFYGVGKTKQIINELIEIKKQFVFVSVRVQLLKQITKRCQDNGLECKLYLDVKDKTFGGYTNYNGSICITPDSLHNLGHYKLNEYVVIFDEAVTMLNKFDAFTNDQINFIKKTIVECYSCVFMDANFQDFHIDYITKVSRCEKRLVDGVYHHPIFIDVKYNIYDKQKEYYKLLKERKVELKIAEKTLDYDFCLDLKRIKACKRNVKKTEKYNVMRTVTEYIHVETLLNEIKNDIINDRKIIVYCDTKKDSNIIENICRQANKNSLLVNGDTSNKLDLSDIDSKIIDDKIQVLIYTNSLSVGTSINIKRYFTKVYAIVKFLINNTGRSEIITGYEEVEQALHRYRDFRIPIHIYLRDKKIPLIDKNDLSKKILKGDFVTKKYLINDYKQNVLDVNTYIDEIELYINQIHYKYMQLENTRLFSREKTKRFTNKYKIISTKTSFTIDKVETNDLSEQLIDTKLITQNEYDIINNKVMVRACITNEEKLQYEKFELFIASKVKTENDLNNLLLEYNLNNLKRVFNVMSIREKVDKKKVKDQKRVMSYNDTTNKQLRNLTLHEVFKDTIEVNKLNANDILIGKSTDIMRTGYDLINRLYNCIIGSMDNEIKRSKDKEEKTSLKEKLLAIKKESVESPLTVDVLINKHDISYVSLLVEIIEKSGYLIERKMKRTNGQIIHNYILKEMKIENEN